MSLTGKVVLVTGGAGFLGKYLVGELAKRKPKDIIIPRSSKLDLRVWSNCVKAVKDVDVVIHAAGNVGGIGYNQKLPGTLFYDNLMMGVQLMEAARLTNVEKFVAVGTICAYPKYTPVPFKEGDLWMGYPEETNAPYGLAKKMLLVQGQSYKEQYNMNVICPLLVNLYGPGDNFDPKSSHVIPALIGKFVQAKKTKLPYVEAWGSGKATREFIYVEDAAKGIILATEKYNKADPVNIGAGMETSIKDLAEIISRLVGYAGKIRWNKSKPDGQPRRCLDTSKALKEFDFKAATNFESGLKMTIDWYQKQLYVDRS